ncbi:hypothetical protein DEO72_LG7g2166 [Vigna unguiculata]|uniref:Uncharacterized protein n=1 Tax=Vigna unguiculata TaxID=3917 RepID=A0A4D6MM84_VIGUN|nr:hypothetical protein DEO72_LG7g2166 [Vigna unguiculata]
MCVHQSRSKHNHAHGKASNGDDNHSRRFVNVGIARHCTTYNRAKHYRTVSSARVFFGPPRPLPRLPFHQRDRCQLLMPLTSMVWMKVCEKWVQRMVDDGLKMLEKMKVLSVGETGREKGERKVFQSGDSVREKVEREAVKVLFVRQREKGVIKA